MHGLARIDEREGRREGGGGGGSKRDLMVSDFLFIYLFFATHGEPERDLPWFLISVLFFPFFLFS